MAPVRRAVIDVGTNSVKLLVADVEGHSVTPIWEGSKQTRLGRGLYETHRLQPEPIAKTARAVARFADAARVNQAESIRVIATSATREAVNARELIEAIDRLTGLRVEVITGEQEADWVFQGVTTDPELSMTPLLLLDVGGGSTEFVLGQGERKHFRESFPLGTVRLIERIPHSDPPEPGQLAACREWIRHFLETEVQPKVAPAIRSERARATTSPDLEIVGTGGTTSILARVALGLAEYDRQRIEGTRLSLEGLRQEAQRLWSLPLAERQEIVGLPPKRADVILTGVLIYEGVMAVFGFDTLRVSTRGLRFAAVMDPANPLRL